MEDEHCHMRGHDVPFKTDNYGITTTPEDEFNITVGRTPCSEKNMLDKKGRRVRVIQRIEELKLLKLARKARLTEEEIIAVVSALHPSVPLESHGALTRECRQVLYTGPMFEVYNAVLRRFPKELFERFEGGGNRFATTIHVLVSAVVKIARVMKLPPGLELFRGLGGLAELPESFYQVGYRAGLRMRRYCSLIDLSSQFNISILLFFRRPYCRRMLTAAAGTWSGAS
jgi:hypothetical protein